ncbi:MAG: sugar phosphate isomerase/epimerase family protein [Candidatus Promineifilaceae bacterium]|jgi:sugar phosphate isomerase/epimerase
MKIGIVTDEISADPETALELAKEWGVNAVELRGFGSDRVPNFSAFKKQRLRELLLAYDVELTAISPGLFKCVYQEERARFPLRTFDEALYATWAAQQAECRRHLEELLPRSIAFAQEMGVQRIISFAFSRGGAPAGPAPEGLIDLLYKAAEQAGAASVDLLIEVEAGFWADTGVRTAAIVEAVNHPRLAINWDPGNAYEAGDVPFPEGYEAARQFVRNVHFKDVHRQEDGSYHYVVDGDIDWEAQIAALRDDGYDGYITVETHMEPKVAAARQVSQRLQRLLGA